MRLRPRITFRHFAPSLAVSDRIRELTARLERFNDRILSCEVVVEAPPAHRRSGAFSVKIEVLVPGGVVNASSGYASQPGHADVYLALQDAFDNVKRQLQDDKLSSRSVMESEAATASSSFAS